MEVPSPLLFIEKKVRALILQRKSQGKGSIRV